MLELDADRPLVAAKPSATVLLLRPEADGPAIFMVRRHSKSGFLGGAYVFPGGKVDPEDGAEALVPSLRGRTDDEMAEALGEEPGHARALYVAAVRETFEEAGVLLAEGASPEELAGLRQSLLDGEPFGSLVARAGLALRMDALEPFVRWVTPRAERRRYDASFFLARSPLGQEAHHDRIEVTEGAWLRPVVALEKADAGEIILAPPQVRTLELLADVRSVDEAFEVAQAAGAPQPIEPLFCPDGDSWFLALPGDPLHSIGEKRVPGPTRFRMEGTKFVSFDPE